MSALRGYSVTTAYSEASVLVFAETVAKAKACAIGSDWLDDAEWIELQVKREPLTDVHAELFGAGELDMSTPEQASLARSLGWYEIVTGPESCKRCGLSPWSLLPESALDADEVCGECRAKEGAA